jgi:hypothetical protein
MAPLRAKRGSPDGMDCFTAFAMTVGFMESEAWRGAFGLALTWMWIGRSALEDNASKLTME